MSDIHEATRRDMLRRSLHLPLFGAGVLTSPSSLAASAGTRTLVAFLSRTGNTRVIAGQLSRAYGADLFEIRAAEPYPEDYEATVERARRERDAGARPRLEEAVADIAAYDTVFLGFPIWGMTAPSLVRTFLAGHDLSGRTLVPFITHGGYGIGSSVEVVARHASRSRLLEPFVMQADQERETLNRVSAWLRTVETEP